MARTAAVFFDVDFTLIHPGPRFQASGYEECCVRHGVAVDSARFETAVAGAASVVEAADEHFTPELYLVYTKRIIELMGGEGAPGLDAAAREIYDEWAEHRHFELYDDVLMTFDALRSRGVRLGLISNSHRCLDSFQSHFELKRLIAVAVSPADEGYLKPHPAIFHAALARMNVSPAEAAMVGDSFVHDITGALRVGMQGVLLARRGIVEAPPEVSVISSLRELPELIC